MIDINRILTENSLAAWFQPIISVQRQSIQILEALTRGIDPASGEVIFPAELFAAAEEQGCLGKLEELCLLNSLRNFSQIQGFMPHAIVSLNIDESLINHMKTADWLPELVKKYHIDPNKIIIEVLESSISEYGIYHKFLEHNRENGFLLALDDVGSQYSGLIRMAEVKPDLIKIDRKLITGLNKEKWQREVVRALTELAHRTGALVVAEGVETIEEALECLSLDVDFQQGFFYSKAHSFESSAGSNCQKAYQIVAEQFRTHASKILRQRHTHIDRDLLKINDIIDVLQKVSYADLDAALYWLTEKHRHIEFIYLLNENGHTISDTIGRAAEITKDKRYIFKPAQKGENLSLKDYYLWLKSGHDSYVSEPYISTATGQECITHSFRFRTADNLSCICCLDVNLNHSQNDLSLINNILT